MGASGLSQLITMEESPTSSTSCSAGASGAVEEKRSESVRWKIKTAAFFFFLLLLQDHLICSYWHMFIRQLALLLVP